MVARVLVALALVAGCERKSALYCQKNPNDLENCPISDSSQSDSPIGCGSDGDCPAKDPICDQTTHVCTGCATHADCVSQVCLPNGTCGSDTDVLYVAQGGVDQGTCTLAAPCATITYALTKVTTARPFIKVSGAITDNATIMGQAVTILAESTAKLTATGTKVALIIAMASDVSIYDLHVVGDMAQSALTSNASTVRLDRVTITGAGKVAIDAKGNGTLFVQRSRIIGNPGGGIQTDANAIFNVTSSFIVGNGNAMSSMVGGATFAAPTASSNRFEFNTVADNQVHNQVTAGVSCTITNALDASNNLITHNSPSPATLSPDTSFCSFTNSKVATDESPFKFRNIALFDYHLMPGSTAIDGAPGDATITTDIDGDFRPQGQAADYGADEYKP